MTNIKPLLSADEIAKRVETLAKEIANNKPKGALVLVALLRGSFMFAADLARELHANNVEVELDFLGLCSYGNGTETTGEVKVTSDTTLPIEDRHVLIIDDILESGYSLICAKAMMHERSAASVQCAVLLEKPGKRKTSVDADYVGFQIEDNFVVGYGLDYAGKYRELPYVGIYEQPEA